MPGFVSSPFPPSRPAFPALCVADRPVRVPLILARWYAIPGGLCVPRAWSSCPSGIPRVSFACACAPALVASASPPAPRVGVARAPRTVPVLGAGGTVPPSPCPSACPALVPCPVWLACGGGRPGPVPPLPGLGLCATVWAGRAFEVCGRGPLPTGCGCRGCGCGDPSPTRQRALLRAGFARCGGVTRMPWGGAPLAWVWDVRGWALSRPQPPVVWGVRPGHTTHWL